MRLARTHPSPSALHSPSTHNPPLDLDADLDLDLIR
jgi:hypothetical protein